MVKSLATRYFKATYIVQVGATTLPNPLPEDHSGPAGSVPSLPTTVPLKDSADISVSLRVGPPPLQQPLLSSQNIRTAAAERLQHKVINTGPV